MLRLAAEFQAFTRDLHDQASDQFAAWVAPGSATVQTVVRRRLTENRQLDRGNAHPASLGSDFGRFGFELGPRFRHATEGRHSATTSRSSG